MTDHLSTATLNALADGELSADQLTSTQEHLAGCQACTSSALFQSLLKSATARAGQRYAAPQELLVRLSPQKLSKFNTRPSISPGLTTATQPQAGANTPPVRYQAVFGWAVAAALLIASLSIILVQRNQQQVAAISQAVSEISDQHIAMLASSQPLAVLSSDRHTVKPWFQGKLPFSFNLPDNLPVDTRLEGANLTYLRNQPVAQLVYSIGNHSVSVFVKPKISSNLPTNFSAESSGFHFISATTATLQFEAISDVDPKRLSQLVDILERTQIQQ